MSYNVTVLDARGAFATVYVAPGKSAVVKASPLATNHQEPIEWHEHAKATESVERERFLLRRLDDREETCRRLTEKFLLPPLFSGRHATGRGTLYTAVYRPTRGEAEYLWRGTSWRQSFGEFPERQVEIDYAAP